MTCLSFPRFSKPFATVALAGALLLPGACFGQALLQWNTNGNTGTETTEPSVFNDTNIAAANLTLGSVNVAANGNRFGGTNWFDTGDTNPTTLAESVAGNDYIQFIVNPNSGFMFTATSFTFIWDRSGTGPANVTLRSSLDGFTANLGTATGIVTGALATQNFSLTGLTDITTPVTFRLYGYSATATGGTGGFDGPGGANPPVNVQLLGSTAAISAVPEPATVIAGIGAVLALGWHGRGRVRSLLNRKGAKGQALRK